MSVYPVVKSRFEIDAEERKVELGLPDAFRIVRHESNDAFTSLKCEGCKANVVHIEWASGKVELANETSSGVNLQRTAHVC